MRSSVFLDGDARDVIFWNPFYWKLGNTPITKGGHHQVYDRPSSSGICSAIRSMFQRSYPRSRARIRVRVLGSVGSWYQGYHVCVARGPYHTPPRWIGQLVA